MMESIILILVMIGTFIVGYLIINLMIGLFNGDLERRYRSFMRKRRKRFR